MPLYSQASLFVNLGPLGTSLFAARDITAGEHLLTFSGPEVDYRTTVAMGVRESYPLQVGLDTYIDLTEPGCYVNHSCSPNAGVVNDTQLVALCFIAQGDEIRFDYSTTMEEDSWTVPCRCGSRACRKVVTDFRFLPRDLRRRYLRLGIVQNFIVDSDWNRIHVGANWRQLDKVGGHSTEVSLPGL